MIHINRKSIKNNLAATVAPAVMDDMGDGYSVGSIWVNVTADRAYICLDKTIGAAVWSELSSPDLNMTTSTDPALNAAVTTTIIDAYSGVIITLTGVGSAQILQDPTDTAAGKKFTVVVKGAFDIEVNGITMTGGEAQRFIWDGASWVAVTAIDADDITATPHGDVVAVKVQSYLDELEDEKVKRIASVDNEIARFDSVDGDIQGYSSNAPTISDAGLADFPGGLKVVDPVDEHGVGDREFNDGRYRDVYKVIYIDAAEFIPCTTNGALQGTYEEPNNDIDLDIFLFEGGATPQRIICKKEFPENWNRGVIIGAKVKWNSESGSMAGDTVEWRIKMGAIGDSDAIDAALGTRQVISDTLLANNGADWQISPKTPNITVAGSPTIGDAILIEIDRNGPGADTMAEKARFQGVTLQIKLAGAVALWT